MRNCIFSAAKPSFISFSLIIDFLKCCFVVGSLTNIKKASFFTSEAFQSFYLKNLLDFSKAFEFSLGGSIILSAALVKLIMLPISFVAVFFF